MMKRATITGIMITVLAMTTLSPAAQKVLKLEECKQLALSNNKRLLAAQSGIDAAKARNAAARLNDLPDLNASAMGVQVGRPIDLLLPERMVTAGADLQQPVYAGGRIRLGKEATAKVVEITQGQKKMTEAEVLLAVETAYWQSIQVREKITLGEKYRQMLLELQRDLQNAFDAGLIYKNDLLRVEVSLNEAELNLTKARDGWLLARLNLAQLIGQPGNADFVAADSIGDTGEIMPQDNKALIDNRPEITVLNKVIEAERLNSKLIKAELLPTVGLGISGIQAYGKHINFANRKDRFSTYFALLNVSVPIFDWGKNRKKVSEQSFIIQAKQIQLEETKELMSLEIQKAYLQVNQAAQHVRLSNTSLMQAEENLRLTNDRYRAGTIVGKDVLEAQAIWQQAYSSMIDAKVEYRINEAAYRKATGTIQ